MRGYVLSDRPRSHDPRAPRPARCPDEVSGEPIGAEGAADPAFVQRLEDRLAVIGPRRGPVIGISLLIWVGLAALAGLAFGRRGLRAALAPAGGGGRLPAGRAAAHGRARAQRAGRTADRRGRPAGAGARHPAPDFGIRGAGDRRRGLRARLRDRRDRRLQPHRALADRPESRGRRPLLRDRQRARGDGRRRWFRSPPAPHWSPGRRAPRPRRRPSPSPSRAWSPWPPSPRGGSAPTSGPRSGSRSERRWRSASALEDRRRRLAPGDRRPDRRPGGAGDAPTCCWAATRT